MPPVTQTLLIANVAVFLLQSASGGVLEDWFALLSRLLSRLPGRGRAHPARVHRDHGRAAFPDPRRLRRALWIAARIRNVFPAAHGHADLPADPDAGALLRDSLRLARARFRGDRHRGRRRALRTPGRHARGLARDPVPPPGVSLHAAALKAGFHRAIHLKIDTGTIKKIPESSNRTRTTLRKPASSSRP